MHKELKAKALKLRTENNLSYSAILIQVPVAKSTLSEWLRHFPLSKEKILELRRDGWRKGEASREKFRETMRSKRSERMKRIYDVCSLKISKIPRDAFFVAGLMLYLGEGSKTNYSKISLANTDPKIVAFFIKWLDEFLDVPKEKLKAQLHLYPNMNLEEEKRFWKSILGFNDSQFYKPYISKILRSSFTYKESFRHGTCSIYFGSVEKKAELMSNIYAFTDLYLSTKIKMRV
ncbi:hypothetical protein A3H53_03270 [Candidatus Nomurabacteria bacterium RIFCSPLOWO2_02_FULL_40_10]|uniref:Uncharacterized protein n=1 Tax=Candidatus Nomurabacteria bacterium RIFCSPLOWO2_02_FULL_40_10 TaxID=1801786 RepID=A0A1F6XVL8_9BACT|nr:MAG: hypothetical protein A3H53_03270 [Candidatus Nomurabacteria bacterium RIFCSPLOWO2_02_FULL_40_10]